MTGGDRSRGFTLVEAMITVALIGILAGVAGGYLLLQLPTYRVNGAVRQIVGDFRLAKTMAVEHGRRIFIQFDPGNARYTVYLDDGDEIFNAVSDRVVKQVVIPATYKKVAHPDYTAVVGTNPHGDSLPADGVSFPANRGMFTPSGTAQGGGVYLHPGQDAGTRRDREQAVMVTGSTGRPRVYRYDGAAWQ